MNTTVYLIRHGHYENPQRIFHGRLPGFPLSEEGRQQVRELAAFLSDKPIIAVYSSPLRRAWQTAEMIASYHNGVAVIKDERLIDVKTPLEGAPVSYIDKIDGNFYTRDLIAQGGERLSELFNRIDDFLKEKVQVHQGQSFIAVTHADLIMSVKVKYLGGRLTHRATRPGYVQMAGGFEIHFNGEFRVAFLSAISRPL